MRTTTRWAAGVILALCGACGGGGDGGDRDAGPGTTDDAGGETTRVLSVRLLDPDEAPIEGVLAALDSSGGRFEGESNAAGELDIPFDAEDGELVTVIYAKHRFLITVEELSVDTIPEERVDRTLGRVGGADRVNVTVTATGVPSGGRICTSFDNFHYCSAPGDHSLTVPVFAFGLGDTVHVFAIDDSENVVDFEAVAVPDGGDTRSVPVDFDGSFDEEPTVRDVTITLPSGDSALPDFEPTPVWPAFFGNFGSETGRMYGISTNVSRDGSTLTLRYTQVAGTEDLAFTSIIWPDLRNAAGVSRNFFESDPGASFEVMGIPTLLAGDSLHSTFEWRPPEGDWTHRLVLENGSGVAHVLLLTDDTNATVPAFPTGFDRNADDSVFPFAGSTGYARAISASRADVDAGAELVTNGTSLRREIAF